MCTRLLLIFLLDQPWEPSSPVTQRHNRLSHRLQAGGSVSSSPNLVLSSPQHACRPHRHSIRVPAAQYSVLTCLYPKDGYEAIFLYYWMKCSLFMILVPSPQEYKLNSIILSLNIYIARIKKDARSLVKKKYHKMTEQYKPFRLPLIINTCDCWVIGKVTKRQTARHLQTHDSRKRK